MDTPFSKYREAYDAMQSDPKIIDLKNDIETLQAMLEDAEQPYRNSMEEAGSAITEFVLENKGTITLRGIEAKYFAPRASTSWKQIAMQYEPPQAQIAQFTTYSDPRVTIKIKEE